ncbi:hypothetical protein [Lichenibacterium dinghuense]|nr:hypothetical protein [Lichenibacterium sp. 6Y81]
MAKGDKPKKESKGKPKKDAKPKAGATSEAAGLMTRGSTEPIGKKK